MSNLICYPKYLKCLCSWQNFFLPSFVVWELAALLRGIGIKINNLIIIKYATYLNSFITAIIEFSLLFLLITHGLFRRLLQNVYNVLTVIFLPVQTFLAIQPVTDFVRTVSHIIGTVQLESILCTIEDLAFWPSNNPSPSPLSPSSAISKLHLRHRGRLRKRDKLRTGGGEGGAKSLDGEKAWSSIIH